MPRAETEVAAVLNAGQDLVQTEEAGVKSMQAPLTRAPDTLTHPHSNPVRPIGLGANPALIAGNHSAAPGKNSSCQNEIKASLKLKK